jgi:3',5'-cyclic AMP phosphodiesterase CpdA
MAAFALAHLSDPHLGPLPKPRLRELIGKRATGYLNWKRRRAAIHRPEVLARIVDDLKRQAPDHIAVTGDLINLALPAEFVQARAWLDALGSPSDVTLVPGNHDAYVRGWDARALAYWGEFMRGDNGAGFPFVRRRGPLALIGLSSAVVTPPFFATGHVGAEQLRRFEQVLEHCRDAFRVVLIHHPPAADAARHLKRLIDAPQLCAALARHGAELVLFGHNHCRQRLMLEGRNGSIPAIGVPSASEAPPGEHDPAGYNLYRIDGQPGAWRCEMTARGVAGDAVAETERSKLF